MGLCGRPSKTLDDEDRSREIRFMKSIKLLLLGTGESGKTTILKQMKILHINGFSDLEKKEKIPAILQNIHESIYDIVDNMDTINPPVNLELPENSISKEYILNLGTEQPQTYTEEYFNHVSKLWSDKGVQSTFLRSNEFQLIDSAEHFLDQIDIIRKPDYIPSLDDVLYCRIRTTTITEIEFGIRTSKMYGGDLANFLVYDVGGQRGERRKWFQVFDGVQAILFIISASDFDQTLREDPSKNRLEEAFSVFSDTCISRYMRNAGLIVFLNKQDLLKRKVEQGHKLGDYFPEYHTYKSDKKSNDEFEKSRDFIEDKILSIAKTEVTIDHFNPIKRTITKTTLPVRETYVHHTIATDTKNIKRVLDSVQEMIIKTVLKGITPF